MLLAWPTPPFPPAATSGISRIEAESPISSSARTPSFLLSPPVTPGGSLPEKCGRPSLSRIHTTPAPALLDLESLESLPSSPTTSVHRAPPESPLSSAPNPWSKIGRPNSNKMPLKKLRPSKNLSSFLPFGLDPKIAEIYGIDSRHKVPAPEPLDLITPPPPPPLGKDDSFSPFGGSMRGKQTPPIVPEQLSGSPLTAPLPQDQIPHGAKGRKRADTVASSLKGTKDKRETMRLPIMSPVTRSQGEVKLEDWEWDCLEGAPGSRSATGQTRILALAPPPISVRSSSTSPALSPMINSPRPPPSARNHQPRITSTVRPHASSPPIGTPRPSKIERVSGIVPIDPVTALEEMSGDMLRQVYPHEMQRFDLGGRQRRPSEHHLQHPIPPPPPSESGSSHTHSTATQSHSHSHSQGQSASASASGRSIRSWREGRKARRAIAHAAGNQQLQARYRPAPPPPPTAPLPSLPARSTSLAHGSQGRGHTEDYGDVVVIDSVPEGPLANVSNEANQDWKERRVPRSSTGMAPPIPPRSELRGLPQQSDYAKTASSVRSEETGSGERVPLVLSMSRSISGDSVTSETPSNTIPIHLRPLPPNPHGPALRQSAQPLPNALSPPAIPRGLSGLQPKIASRLRLKRPTTAPHPAPSHDENVRKGSLTRLLPLTSTKSKAAVMPSPMYESPQSTPPDYAYAMSGMERPSTRMSAREEPPAHARLARVQSNDDSIHERSTRAEGMTALSFLALDDPYTSHSRSASVMDQHPSQTYTGRDSSVVGHILPPKELSKIGPSHLRKPSAESGPPLSSPDRKRSSFDVSKRKSAIWSQATTRRPYTGTSLSPPPRPRGAVSTGPMPLRSLAGSPAESMGMISSLSMSHAVSPSSTGLGESPTLPVSPWRSGIDARSAPPTRTSFFDHSYSNIASSAASPDGFATRDGAQLPTASREGPDRQSMEVTAPTPSPPSSDISVCLAASPHPKTARTPSLEDSSDEDEHSLAISANATPRGPRSRSRTEHYVHPPVYNRTTDSPYGGAPHAMAGGMKSAESLILDTSLAHIRPPPERRSLRDGLLAGEGSFTGCPTSPAPSGVNGIPRKVSTSTTQTMMSTGTLRLGKRVEEDAVSIWSAEGGLVERAKERKAMNDWLAKPISRRTAKGSGEALTSVSPVSEWGGWSVGGGVYGLRPLRDGSVSAVDLLST